MIILVTDGTDVSSRATLDDCGRGGPRGAGRDLRDRDRGPEFDPGAAAAIARADRRHLPRRALDARRSPRSTLRSRSALGHTWQIDYVTAGRPATSSSSTPPVPARRTPHRAARLTRRRTAASRLPRAAYGRRPGTHVRRARLVGAPRARRVRLCFLGSRRGSWLHDRARAAFGAARAEAEAASRSSGSRAVHAALPRHRARVRPTFASGGRCRGCSSAPTCRCGPSSSSTSCSAAVVRRSAAHALSPVRPPLLILLAFAVGALVPFGCRLVQARSARRRSRTSSPTC